MSTRRRLMSATPALTRQSETGVLEQTEGGTYQVRVAGRSEPYSGLNGTWLDADNQTGSEVRIGYVQSDPFLPIMFDRNSRPNSRIVIGDGADVDLFTDWTRFADGFDDWFRKEELDIPGSASTSVRFEGVPTVDLASANIVRLFGENTFYAVSGTLNEIGPETSLATTFSEEDEIVAMVTPGGVPLCLVYGQDESLLIDCDDAFTAGFDFGLNDFEAFLLGKDSCDFPGTSTGSVEGDYQLYYEPNIEVPAQYTGENEQCYLDGVFEGFSITFNDGRADSGCGPF